MLIDTVSKTTTDDLLDILNDLLIENDIETSFSFVLISTTGHVFSIILEEHNTAGLSFQIFYSEDIFNEDIEKEYEEGKIDYLTAVKNQIKSNITQLTSSLNTIQAIFK